MLTECRPATKDALKNYYGMTEMRWLPIFLIAKKHLTLLTLSLSTQLMLKTMYGAAEIGGAALRANHAIRQRICRRDFCW
jgi:hypothetical protein